MEHTQITQITQSTKYLNFLALIPNVDPPSTAIGHQIFIHLEYHRISIVFRIVNVVNICRKGEKDVIFRSTITNVHSCFAHFTPKG